MSDKAIIIKYTKNGDIFEVFIDPNLAYEYITGKRSDPVQVLDVETIFKDARKGERQSEEKIKKAFGTNDIAKIAETILKNSDIPLTTEQKRKLTEEKRKQIINIIATNSIDPRTNAPNPPLRIENAMNESRISIDPMKSATEQVDSIVKKISLLLPIKFTTAKIQVTIPADAANRCYGIIKRYGLKSEEWLSNGNLRVVVEFPAGLQNEFFDRINKATEGRAETTIL